MRPFLHRLCPTAMASKPKPASPAQQLHEELTRVVELVREVSAAIPRRGQAMAQVRAAIDEAAAVLQTVHQELDDVKLPGAMFDLQDPRVVGRIVAMAMLAQEKTNLASLGRFYGSGIYALYYKGSLPVYAPLANTDHPIYVGKADPAMKAARNPIDQGEKLVGRLLEHRKSITKGANLSPEDFECRYLVVSSGAQEAAESHLKNLYNPIWNNESNVCFGIGKHGDNAETRSNSRSPWDTLHPGRKWADNPLIKDGKSGVQVEADIAAHLAKFPPIRTREEAVERLLREMTQI